MCRMFILAPLFLAAIRSVKCHFLVHYKAPLASIVTDCPYIPDRTRRCIPPSLQWSLWYSPTLLLWPYSMFASFVFRGRNFFLSDLLTACFSLLFLHPPFPFPMSLCSSWQTYLNKRGQAPLLNNWWNDCSPPSPSAEHLSRMQQVVRRPAVDGPVNVNGWKENVCQLRQNIWTITTLCIIENRNQICRQWFTLISKRPFL